MRNMVVRTAWRRTELLEAGWTDRKIAAAVANGPLVRVRRGWYAFDTEWQALWPEQKHLELVRAMQADARGDGVPASHVSAAAVHHLPFYRLQPKRVHAMADVSERTSSATDTLRHVADLPDTDVTIVDGLLCTTLERTVFDVIRALPFEAAVCMADAALRIVAADGQRYDEDRAAEFIADIRGRLGAAAGARGIRRARTVLEIADGRSQSPGESVGKVLLKELGFKRLTLQVPVPSPNGGSYWVDIGIDDVNAFGEFDGRKKYTDEAMRSGRTIDQVILDEKMREDWIRGTTDRRLVRWSDEHNQSAAALGARLAAFGIYPPRH